MNAHSEELLASLASGLAQAERTATPIAPIRNSVGADDLEAAYRIQGLNHKTRLDAGGRITGRKIGLTSKVVQKQLGVDTPDFGALFADMAYGHNEPIPASGLIAPKVEGEIAFVLGRDIDVSDPTVADVLRATEYAMPSIEIVDSRITNWDIGLIDTVADNASAAAYTLGNTATRIDGLDLSGVRFSMTCNGEEVSTGSGADCLGHPLNAVVWLARTLARLGDPLRAGDVVLSGALGPMVPVKVGDTVTAHIEGLGEATAIFSEGTS